MNKYEFGDIYLKVANENLSADDEGGMGVYSIILTI